ncbi:hypothetical protein BDN72DRAFT_831082 [Pluteus cervinus]|uniref:Uncharacterized protein n=1 Tax=Pluteus cervinus TaxID=181527 RepID=A0ACD3BEK0_9AGAR|nr:hypothetical protein BDN72DRAFT_831082 [Pluteus cervinus]
MSAEDSFNNLQRVDSTRDTPQDEVENDNKEILGAEAEHAPATPPVLPTIPSESIELDIDLSAILGPTEEDGVEKIKKRQSNVLKLSEENEKLKAQLKAMTDRIEAAERKREELAKRAHQRDPSHATAVGAK